MTTIASGADFAPMPCASKGSRPAAPSSWSTTGQKSQDANFDDSLVHLVAFTAQLIDIGNQHDPVPDRQAE
jgi:hypothetical protein